MEIELDINKSVHENAAIYFELAKKAKGKIEGVNKAINIAEKKLKSLEQKKEKEEEKKTVVKIEAKKEWYDKFRWFYSSEGLLCIGGRDATTNDILIKKHLDETEIVFHTEMAGSPFFIALGKPGDATIEECAIATACFSKVWKNDMPALEVFYVQKDQVSLTPKAGEFMPKGSFMIYGRKTQVHAKLEMAIGIKEGKIVSGPVKAIAANSEKSVRIIQGSLKPSDAAKKIARSLGTTDYDSIIRMMPSGNIKIVS